MLTVSQLQTLASQVNSGQITPQQFSQQTGIVVPNTPAAITVDQWVQQNQAQAIILYNFLITNPPVGTLLPDNVKNAVGSLIQAVEPDVWSSLKNTFTGTQFRVGDFFQVLIQQASTLASKIPGVGKYVQPTVQGSGVLNTQALPAAQQIQTILNSNGLNSTVNTTPATPTTQPPVTPSLSEPFPFDMAIQGPFLPVVMVASKLKG